MAGVLQLSQALSKCSIASCGSAAVSHRSSGGSSRGAASSVSTSLAPTSLWGIRVGSRKTRQSSSVPGPRSVTAMALFQGDDYEETEEEIEAGYIALYGKPFGQGGGKKWDSVEDKDSEGDDVGALKGRRGRSSQDGRRDDRGGGRGAKGEFEERVVQIRRVTKVVKGGKQLSFRAVVVVGDKRGKVGVGVNKAKEVITAVQKAVTNAKRNLVTVPMTKYKTFPHRADGHYGSAHVMLRPASTGTGVIAGGAVRVVLEMAGVENALGKQIRSENPLNNARAVVEAISGMKTFRQVSTDRGIPMEELWA